MTADEARQGRRVVVGVDGSTTSGQAVDWAAEQAQLTGASLVLVAAWHVSAAAYGSWGTAPIPPSVDLDLAKYARETLDRVADEVEQRHPELGVVRRVVEGPPALVLLDEAQGADLLVVGSRGHGAFRGMLLGSVSQHCVTHARCPVVVMPGRD